MSALPFFQVDAFASRPFEGNPAAVMPLSEWLPDEVMQAIAAENNLAETAFTVPSESGEADYDLRWFTPTVEVDLCGHATLASGHVLMTGGQYLLAVTRGWGRGSRGGPPPHDRLDAVEEALQARFPGTEILIHLDPHGHTDRETMLPSHLTENVQ